MFLLPALVFTFVVVVRLLAGGRPAASHLFCFAKKGNPKKAPQSRCPCGMPNCAGRKMGKVRNSPAAQTRTFLIHFPPRTIGSATCEFDSKSKSKTESKAASDCRNSKRLSIACAERRQSHYGCFDFRRPHVALPLVLGRKWKKKRPCLSVASCGHFPFCDLHNRAPEGQRKRSPSFAYIFLAKQEK